MQETAWLKLLQDYDNHLSGDVIPVVDAETIDYMVTNEVAEILDLEAHHSIQEDADFMNYGVERDRYVFVMADVPVYLETVYPKWKLKQESKGDLVNG